ncbi:MAG: hypothetical protein U9Q92_00665 [archaeon]|nr:hypothetical protein [archaeon]
MMNKETIKNFLKPDWRKQWNSIKQLIKRGGNIGILPGVVSEIFLYLFLILPFSASLAQESSSILPPSPVAILFGLLLRGGIYGIVFGTLFVVISKWLPSKNYFKKGIIYGAILGIIPIVSKTIGINQFFVKILNITSIEIPFLYYAITMFVSQLIFGGLVGYYSSKELNKLQSKKR